MSSCHLRCHLENHKTPRVPRTPVPAVTLTEHGHELLGVEVPVAPVGPVAVQCGILLVVVRRLGPKGVNDPDPAPALPKTKDQGQSPPASPWGGGGPAVGTVTGQWLVEVGQCAVRAWEQMLPGCVTTAGTLTSLGPHWSSGDNHSPMARHMDTPEP